MFICECTSVCGIVCSSIYACIFICKSVYFACVLVCLDVVLVVHVCYKADLTSSNPPRVDSVAAEFEL